MLRRRKERSISSVARAALFEEVFKIDHALVTRRLRSADRYKNQVTIGDNVIAGERLPGFTIPHPYSTISLDSIATTKGCRSPLFLAFAVELC